MKVSCRNTPNCSTTKLGLPINPSISRLSTGSGSTSKISSPSYTSLSSSPASPNYSDLSLPELLVPPPAFQSNVSLGTFDPLLPINLNDGARAIAAFCRPYPTKSVGTPIDINFDIKSSNFTLSIRLEADEVPDSELATEIFIPLIHYATYPSRISQLCRNEFLDEECEVAEDAYDARGTEEIEVGGRGTPIMGGRSLGPRGISSSPLSLPNEKEEEDPSSLSLKVKVSAGRWETEGQYLKWYYPRPTSGFVIYKIEISRMNGPIPQWCQQPSTSSGVR